EPHSPSVPASALPYVGSMRAGCTSGHSSIAMIAGDLGNLCTTWRSWHTWIIDSRSARMDQLSFASLDYAAKKKRTKRDVFLAEMAAEVPLVGIEGCVKPT